MAANGPFDDYPGQYETPWRYDPKYRCVWNATGQSVVSHVGEALGRAIADMPQAKARYDEMAALLREYMSPPAPPFGDKLMADMTADERRETFRARQEWNRSFILRVDALLARLPPAPKGTP